jgi:hypothetical protein
MAADAPCPEGHGAGKPVGKLIFIKALSGLSMNLASTKPSEFF